VNRKCRLVVKSDKKIFFPDFPINDEAYAGAMELLLAVPICWFSTIANVWYAMYSSTSSSPGVRFINISYVQY